jgi:hypothetical protein
MSKLTPATGRAPATVASRARTTLLLSAGVTLALYLIPYGNYVAYPLLLISTLVHELGHGVAAILVGGDFVRFEMYADGSGVAFWRGNVGALGRAFVSAGGLVGPAVGAALFLVLARHPKTARYTMGVFGALLVLAMALVVRNGFGLLFVGALAGASLAIAIKANDEVNQLGLVFLAVQLALSVYSRGDYLFTQYAETGAGRMPSDVQKMSDALGMPYWFWGGVCAAISALVLIVGGWYFVRGARGSASRPPTVSSSILPRRAG